MNNRLFLFCLLAVFATSCVNELQDDNQDVYDAPVFYATIEQAGGPSTKVFADDSLRVLWNADDRVSIFNKSTYNRQYRFDGQDGANSGVFKKVPSDDFVASNPLNYVYSVYPYNENTSISNDGEITVYLPAEQSYREDSFGLGANTMIAITEDDELMFKNLCGYFAIKLYGDNVSVSSITLRGNNNEHLAGKAKVVAQTDTAPTIQFDAANATREIVLNCPSPVRLGTSAETATSFWFVIPPSILESGFTLIIRTVSGVFSKTAHAPLEIKRNVLKSSAALEVIPIPSDDPIPFADPEPYLKEKLVSLFDTDQDGEISYSEAASVTAFPAGAFSGLYIQTFDELQFFTGITEIPDSLFYRCFDLASITLPAAVQTIGKSAFESCYDLTSINIPKALRTIGYHAFNSCNRLSGVYIEDMDAWLSIKYNSWRANPCRFAKHLFLNGEEVTRIVIPEGVTAIGNYQFQGLSSLEEVIIPNSVIEIGTNAFSYCSGLSSISLPERLTTIGIGAFSDCSGLTSILIPDSVTMIGASAFSYCSGLTSLTLGSGVTRIENNAFRYCDNLSEVHISDWDAWTSILFVDQYSNPMYYAKHLFLNGVELSNLVLPEGTTVIPHSYFLNNKDIISFVIPDTVTRIEDYAFAGCSEMTAITIPSSVQSIGTNAFDGCEKLSSVYIQDWDSWMDITYTNAFSNPMVYASHLFLRGGEVNYTNLYVQSLQGAQEIKTALFAGCNNLNSITIPNSVTTIGESAFYGCESLSSVTIPESVVQVGTDAFLGCKSITTVNINSLESWCGINFSSLYSNPLNAFNSTTSIPADQRDIHLLVDGEEMEDIEIPDGVTEIKPNAFSGFLKLKSVSIPVGVNTIGVGAFYNCQSLSTINIPEGVTTIESSSFSGCGLTSVTLPESIAEIKSYAFYACSKLSTIRVLANTPPTGGYRFLDMTNDCPIYVPATSVDAYKTAQYWSNYASRIQAIPSSSNP